MSAKRQMSADGAADLRRRAAADAMQTMFDLWHIDMKVPSHDAIEQWTLRLGVASLQSPFKVGERMLWMVDHSSQIGKERLLLIVGVALDDLPPPGETLTFDKMKVLAVVLGQSWKKEDVEREYLKLAQEIGPLFTWSMMVLYHLNTPGSNSRIWISHERMEQKLGWLREYTDDLVRWNQCQEVIDRSLSVINRQGLHARTAELVDQSLREHNPSWRNEDSSSTRIGVQLLDWIQKSSSQLKVGERAWLSTEILESLFCRYKQVERQHSKGGFTRLIAALPTLCMRVTPATVGEAFIRVDSKATQKWIQDSLGSTLTARGNAAYREFKAKIRNHAIATA